MIRGQLRFRESGPVLGAPEVASRAESVPSISPAFGHTPNRAAATSLD